MENFNNSSNEKNAVKPQGFFKVYIDKLVAWFKEKTKDVNWKEVWDKFTTGLLIFLISSPLLILCYIFLWFIMK